MMTKIHSKMFLIPAIIIFALLACNNYKTSIVDLRPLMSEVKHQGERNTCSVFAATALMEYLIKAEHGIDLDLSEQYNYWAAKKYSLHNDYLKSIYEGIDGLAGYLAVDAYRYGSMLESDWPYETQNWLQTGNDKCININGIPSKECFTGILPENAQILPYRIEPVFIERTYIAQYIMENRKPVVFNIMWYFDSMDHDSGSMKMPEDDTQEGGGHVVLLVGYDKKNRQFFFRNSWGNEWGDNGYGTIPEHYIKTHYEAAQFEPFDQYDPEAQELLINASKGVSGYLVPIN